MIVFRTLIVVAWLVMLPITIQALVTRGVSGLGVFVSDFDNPWRAQINADFSVHLGLAMTWIVFREQKLARGLILAVPVLLGSIYLLPYILAASFNCNQRFDTLLVGRRRQLGSHPQC